MSETDPQAQALITGGRHFCLAPWLHMHVPIFGTAVPCCLAQGDFGDFRQGDVEAFRHSPAMNAMRANMLRDRPDPRCRNCTRAEALGFASLRQRFNREFSHHGARVAATAADGSIGAARPVSWDLRFSNLCNFRCRMCFHGSSSHWHGDAVALGLTMGDGPLLRGVADANAFIGALEPDIANLEEVYFAGGEPLLMEEHWRILDLLLEHGRTDVRLDYNSNLSRLSACQRDAIESWQRFGRVSVKVSVDGLGERGEYIRNGFKWRTFAANVRRVRTEAPHVALTADVTVSILNVMHLPELHRRLTEEALFPAHAFEMHPLFVPEHYSVSLLPRALRRQALRQLEQHQAWIGELESHGQLDQAQAGILTENFAAVARLLEEASEVPRRQARKGLRAITAKLDQLRGEDASSVLNELRPLLRAGPLERLRDYLAGKLKPR